MNIMNKTNWLVIVVIRADFWRAIFRPYTRPANIRVLLAECVLIDIIIIITTIIVDIISIVVISSSSSSSSTTVIINVISMCVIITTIMMIDIICITFSYYYC